jgi:hypothetical protein
VALSDIEMKPSHCSNHRHARVSGMNTFFLIVIVGAIFAACWHWKKRTDDRKYFQQMTTDNSRVIKP